VTAGSGALASGLMRRSLSALVLLPVSRVAGRFCPLPFRPTRGAEAEAPLGYGTVPDLVPSFIEAKDIDAC
jgi:hypothetical protein